MNKLRNKELINKYLEGETSLGEEKELFNEQVPTDKNIERWSHYKSHMSKKAPDELKGLIRSKLQSSQSQQLNIRLAILSAAAMMVILFSFWVYNSQSTKEMSLEQKREVLKEALRLFEDEAPPPSKVLYEDELIIIYMAPKSKAEASINLEEILEQF